MVRKCKESERKKKEKSCSCGLIKGATEQRKMRIKNKMKEKYEMNSIS
jgi:hypothetical protein